MGLLQELFRTHGPAYLDRFGSAIPKAHRKVIAAIADCHRRSARPHYSQAPAVFHYVRRLV